MKNLIISMYITFVPLIATGIFNMIFCKMNVLKKLSIPLDGGKNLKDGKRLFGDNKTIKGFLGYVFLGMVCNVIWGIICSGNTFLESHNMFFKNYDNTLVYNFIIGLLIGLAYAVFELPNSFAKRRLGIGSGQSLKASKLLRVLFMIIDQCDSIIGCVLVVWCVYPLGIKGYLLYVLLGLVTHLVINMILYVCKLRNTIF